MIDRYVSPAELRRLISALLVVATFITINAFFAFLIVPGARAVNRPKALAELENTQLDTGWLDPAEAPTAQGYTVPPVDPKTVMTPNPELLAKGKELYTKTCSSCHGAEGKGNGPAGASLNPKPRDLTVAGGWKNGPRLPELFKTLDEGIKGSSMVSYNFLPKKDRMAILHHVQSLAGFQRPAEDAKALDAVAKLVGSAGEVVPPRIPVSLAMRHLSAEASPMALALRADAPEASALADAARAARTLATHPEWRSSEQALARVALANLGTNGFSASVATYDNAQWKALKAALEAASK